MLTLPALSVAVAVILYSPSTSGLFGVNSHDPSAFTGMFSAMISLPFLRVIVEPASAVPLNVGVLSFVVPPLTSSLNLPPLTSSITSVMTGASGAVLSVKSVLPAVPSPLPLLPALSVTSTFTLSPGLIGSVVISKSPLSSVVPVPIILPSLSLTTTGAFGSSE